MTAVRRRASWCAGLVLLLLAGCGAAGADTVSTSAGVGAPGGRGVPPGPPLTACGRAQPLVNATLEDVSALVRGAGNSRAALPALTQALARLQGEARAAGDDAVEHALQDAADALRAYLAAAADPSVGAYEDVVADVVGTLRGFAATCPVRNPGFAGRTSDWTAAAPTTTLALVPTGHDGPGALELRNLTGASAVVAATAPRDTVALTGRVASYRVGVWVRSAGADGAVLTLTVRERAAGGQLLSTQQVDAALTPAWALVGLTSARTARGSSLEISVSVASVPARGAVQLDDFSVARD